MSNQADDLRKQILELVKHYHSAAFPPRDFQPGQAPVPYAGRVFDADELVHLVDSALDFWLTTGRFAEQFERRFARFFGLNHAVLTNSGSSANLLALSCLTSPKLNERRLRPGDEVITAATGFPTTVNPIIQNQLVPVFLDVQVPTYNLDVRDLDAALSEKTRAVMVAHTLGNPFDLSAVVDFARRHDLWLIEDCCDAVGATYQGQPVGTFGDLATTSFYPAHHITMGEGGCVLTNKALLKTLVESFRDWGRACFLAGTPVNVAEGVKPIEEIQIGDKVWTHEGRYRPVTETMRRSYSGRLYTIKARMRPPITATAEHPFWVQRNGRCQWIEARNLTVGDHLLEAVPLRDRLPAPFEWNYATAYKIRHERLEPDPDLMRLIGYWLAEGCVLKGLKGESGYKESKYFAYRVSFAFHQNERHYVEDVVFLMKKFFGVSGYQRKQSHSGHATQGMELSFKTRKGYEFFRQFFGKGAHHKKLPDRMSNWPLNLTRELVKGYWRGDGSQAWHGFSLHSTSPILLEQIRRILLKAGILCSVWKREIARHHSAVVNGKTIVAKAELHAFNTYGENAQKFGEFVGVPYTARSRRYYAFLNQTGKYACYPIVEIQSTVVRNEAVYNIEVEGDASYHAGGIAVHNCWCPPGKDNTCGKRFDWQLGDLPHGYDHKYIYSHVGYNLKLTDMQAAVGLAQLDKLPAFIEARRRNFQRLYEGLRDLEEFFLLPEATPGSEPSWFGFPLAVRPEAPFPRSWIVTQLEQRRIATRLLFGGNLVRQPAYREVRYRQVGSLANADFVMNQVFWIGVYPGLTGAMLDYVIESLHGLCKGNH